jgi:hypothetical protein
MTWIAVILPTSIAKHVAAARHAVGLDRGEALEDAHASEIRRCVLRGREVQ